MLKYNKGLNPLLFLFELLETVKLIFQVKIVKAKKRKGKGKRRKPKERAYPYLVGKHKQYSISLGWIMQELKGVDSSRTFRLNRIKAPFVLSFYEKFSVLQDNIKVLLKKRSAYYKRVVYFNHKIRYP